MSPTQRSLAHMRALGATVVVVEHYNWFSKSRQDLFGILDLVALLDGDTIGIQTTSAANVSARVKKITECEHLPALRKAGWTILVHGWRKGKDGKWALRVVDLS